MRKSCQIKDFILKSFDKYVRIKSANKTALIYYFTQVMYNCVQIFVYNRNDSSNITCKYSLVNCQEYYVNNSPLCLGY